MFARPFTQMMVNSEIDVLTRLHGMLENDPVNTREEFGDLMKAAFDRGKLDPRGLSDDMGYNISAIYRWIDGQSAPHKSLWPRVVTWIMQAIEQKIEHYKQDDTDDDVVDV